MPHELYGQVPLNDVSGLTDELNGRSPVGHAHNEFAKLPYITTVPPGSASPVITHDLGTLDVDVTVYRASDGNEVGVPVRRTGANTIVLEFAAAPSANQFRVIVSAGHGNGGVIEGGASNAPHAATHSAEGTDPVTPTAIGAAPTVHTHSVYALTSHVHAAYALNEHDHPEYENTAEGKGPPIALNWQTTITTPAASGNHFRIHMLNNTTLLAPSNPTDGQLILWEISAEFDLTATLQTGNGAFQYGRDIYSMSLCLAGQVEYMQAIYDARAVNNTGRWRVISYIKGFPK